MKKLRQLPRRPWFIGLGAFTAYVAMVMLLFSPFADSQATASPETVSPDAALEEGLRLAREGAFERAAGHLEAAAEAFAQDRQLLRQSDVLTALAQVYLSLGYHMKAAQSLELALGLAQASKDRVRQAAVLGALGQVYLAAGQVEPASEYLAQGLSLAQQEQDSPRVAVIQNELGRLYALQHRNEEALAAFEKSRSNAEASGVPALSATAMVNAGRMVMRLHRHDEARRRFDEALPVLQKLEASHDKAYGLINLGLAYAELGSRELARRDQLDIRAATVLEEAGEVAESIDDARAISYAFGYRGHLYEKQGRFEEALLLTRVAVMAAQRVHAPESLYLWEWQTGRLLKALGKPDEAISAYRRAADTVQSIRPEMAFTTTETAASFRESGGRLFFELADLLLQRAAAAPDEERARPYLVQARKAVELFKSAELRDYFRDDCVDALQARKKPLEEVLLGGAAVIYPILLSDRTELLVSLPGGIERFGVPVTADRMTSEVRAFRRRLEKRTTREYLPHAQQLYDWLIRPLESRLTALSINTLIVVPDGALRTIPMAALHDGEKFLVEKYAVATTPGLDLTDPRPFPRERVRVLSAGLTEGVQGFPPLPNVATELQALEELYGSRPLLNRAFVVGNFAQELREKEFTIVHVASHGKFESQAGQSFLLTFDGRLTMEQLSQVVGYFRFRDQPLELLTLSACQTAAGDDRAALGLAGVAVKAGARSALATLWFINDESSSALVAEFYRQLQDPSLSKAQALQRAQMKLLDNPKYEHPSYWSPFLLLNNWL